MTGSGLANRRFRSAAPSRTPECRLCWRIIVLEPDHLEVTEQHVYVRCPHCRGSFPIRHSDMEAFAGNESSAVG
jgi:hypothetical protein